jgi:hypothetical protein
VSHWRCLTILVQVVTTEVPVYVDKLVINEVVKEVEKTVTKEAFIEDEVPLIEFKSEKTKSQRSGTRLSKTKSQGVND